MFLILRELLPVHITVSHPRRQLRGFSRDLQENAESISIANCFLFLILLCSRAPLELGEGKGQMGYIAHAPTEVSVVLLVLALKIATA